MHSYLNTFMLVWSLLGQRKTSLVVFLWKWRTSSVVFLLFLMAYISHRNIIVAKKTTELVFLFHKNTTKLVFPWPNISKKNIKVLTILTSITELSITILMHLHTRRDSVVTGNNKSKMRATVRLFKWKKIKTRAGIHLYCNLLLTSPTNKCNFDSLFSTIYQVI